MRNALSRLARAYGANPLHLLAFIACFALAGYVATRLVDDPLVVRMLIWFLAAVIGHDLVLFPLYALADRSLTGLLRMLPTVRLNRTPVVSPLNYLRIPALGTGLLLLLFLPGIIQQGQQTYLNATGLTQQPYLGRWLVLTAALFGVSAIAYALRSRHATAPFRAVARELRPLLARRERILTIAYQSEQRAGALCTTHALYYLDSPHWRRVGWADLADIRWHAGKLTVTGLPGAPVGYATVCLSDPGNLVEVAHSLIANATIVTVTRDLGVYRAVISVRRQPRSDLLVWRVHLGDGIDPSEPDVRRRIDAELTAISDDLGLPPP